MYKWIFFATKRLNPRHVRMNIGPRNFEKRDWPVPLLNVLWWTFTAPLLSKVLSPMTTFAFSDRKTSKRVRTKREQIDDQHFLLLRVSYSILYFIHLINGPDKRIHWKKSMRKSFFVLCFQCLTIDGVSVDNLNSALLSTKIDTNTIEKNTAL